MRGFAIAEDKDELMLRPVERTHSALIFGPNADIKQRVIGMLACLKNVVRVSPIHTREVHRSGFAVPGEEFEVRCQEFYELFLRHLTRRHLEFAMMNRPISADVAIDRDVVGRIDEYCISSTSDQPGGRHSMTKLEAALVQLVNKALSGDIRAFREVIRLREKVQEQEPFLVPPPVIQVEFIHPKTKKPITDNDPEYDENGYRYATEFPEDLPS